MDKINYLKKIWNNIKTEIKEYITNEVFYEEIFLKSFVKNVIDNDVYIQVVNEFAKSICENMLKDPINQICSQYTDTNYNFIFIAKKDDLVLKKKITKNIEWDNTNLNTKLNFSNYIIGPHNKKIFNCAKKIINDETNIKVFFIYGSTGLGKTHLVNALGMEYKAKFPEKKVLFLSTEDFIRNLSRGFSNSTIEEYKDSFKDIDLLIIDDIQFLGNKEKFTEIFFNIFNYMTERNKKIFLTSDCEPKTLKMNERMISRFNSGLALKITTPNIETTKEIIKSKIANEKFKFTNDAIEFVALNFNNDIRTLEGIINKVIFTYSLEETTDKKIDKPKIKEIIDFEVQNEFIVSNYSISPSIIIEMISDAYQIDKNKVLSKAREKQVSFVRKICIYVLKEKFNFSYSKIANILNRNHSTIIELFKNINEIVESDINLKTFIDNIVKNA